MTESIYAPPESDIEVNDNTDGSYYVVAPAKFLTLAIATVGLYLVYWSYRQWRMVKQRDETSIWPVPRGLFYIFFTHSLYADINAKLKRDQASFSWKPGMSATLVVVATIVSNGLGWMSGKTIGSPLTDIASLVMLLLLAVVALPGQKAANAASGDADGTGNERLTGANWAWLILGGLIWIQYLFGIYLVVTHPELFTEP
jgi:hypothetical protein